MNRLANILLLSIAGLLPFSSLHAAEVGHKLGACPLTQLSNSIQPVELKSFSGKVLYIDFWASWCPPCAKSFPFLNELQQQYAQQGLQIIGVNLDEQPEDAEKFLVKFPAKFTLASDLTKQCAENFGVAAMPSSYLIDRKGVIRHIHLGFRAGETEELHKLVKQLLAEPVI